MSTLERLVEQIEAGVRDRGIGVLANDLLREFQTGRGIEDLRLLLTSWDQAVVESGVWIASELGGAPSPLLADFVTLLRHPSKNVRFLAIDCVLSCATADELAELAAVLPLIDDAEPSVRWKAESFLMRATSEQLRAALAYLTLHVPESEYIDRLRTIVNDRLETPL